MTRAATPTDSAAAITAIACQACAKSPESSSPGAPSNRTVNSGRVGSSARAGSIVASLAATAKCRPPSAVTISVSATSALGTAILTPVSVPSAVSVEASGSALPSASHSATVPRPSSSGCSSFAAQCAASGDGASAKPICSETTASSTMPNSATSGQPSSTMSSQCGSGWPSSAIARIFSGV